MPPQYCLLPTEEVENALEALSTVGGVSVNRSYIGIARGSDGVSFSLDGTVFNETGNATSLFPVWTIVFDGECSFEEAAWTFCPANIGDLQVRIPEMHNEHRSRSWLNVQTESIVSETSNEAVPE